MFGFRYDRGRDAYVLRLIGGHVGPVLRTGPPIDSAAEAMEWPDEMQQQAARRRKSGRFARDPDESQRPRRDVLKR
jgi:hypothetical protein